MIAIVIDGYRSDTPAEFPKLVKKVGKYCTDGKEPVYGLENAYGYGRTSEMKNAQSGYYAQNISAKPHEKEGFYLFEVDLSIMTMTIECRDVKVEKIKRSEAHSFWENN